MKMLIENEDHEILYAGIEFPRDSQTRLKVQRSGTEIGQLVLAPEINCTSSFDQQRPDAK